MIKELTPLEANQLRERIRKRFLGSPFNGAGFRVSQYKKSYQPLADDILQAVGDKTSAASVTTNRLRKLFYYTDPAICDPDKLERPSFGDDFVQALFRYIESESGDGTRISASSKTARRWLGPAGVILLLVLLAACWVWMENWPVYWEEPFDDVRPAGLRSRGFELIDYDSVAFGRQPQPGCLTLYTYPGDYWTDPDRNEKPFIKNLVVKRLGSEQCVVSAGLTNHFNPFMNWQQAGIFLLGPTLDRRNCLRITFVYDFSLGNSFQYKDYTAHSTWKYQTVLMQNGVPYEQPPVFMGSPELIPLAAKRTAFSIRIDHRKVQVSYLAGPDGLVFQNQVQEIELPFQPAYVGLAAFQGFTDTKGQPLNADTIPACFDYLKTEPLNQ